MIPEAFIIEWRHTAPWQSDAYVEQDLLITKVLNDIYSNNFLKSKLAFRGGTALHKLFLNPATRYSEDIDLVQLDEENIGDVLTQLRKTLDYLGKPISKAKQSNNVLIYKYQSEIPPIISMKLKIEINCREHNSFLPLQTISIKSNSEYIKQSSSILTYQIEEILATKLRALYQRKKGRDLFDLYFALKHHDVKIDQVIQGFNYYLALNNNKVTCDEFLKNLEDKIIDESFLNDMRNLVTVNFDYNPQIAFNYVVDRVIKHI